MEICIKIEAPELNASIDRLATILDQFATMPKCGQSEAKPETMTGINSKPEAEPKTAANNKPDTEPTAEPETAADIEPNTEPNAKQSYTFEQICNAGAALVDQGKMGQVVALLQNYGVQTIKQLIPDQYAGVAADLIALGAKL